MLASIFGGGVLSTIVGSLFSSILGVFNKTVDASVETYKTGANASVSLLSVAMSHRTYWLAWGIAVVPMSAWFGWGMLDTLCDGALPDVAAIPPGLLPYATIVWSNLFWVGSGAFLGDRAISVFDRWLNR